MSRWLENHDRKKEPGALTHLYNKAATARVLVINGLQYAQEFPQHFNFVGALCSYRLDYSRPIIFTVESLAEREEELFDDLERMTGDQGFPAYITEGVTSKNIIYT